MLDLSPDHLTVVRRILSKHLPHREVRAFGSRTTGTTKPHSDLDLVVMGEPAINEQIRSDLAADFDDSELPFRVDLLFWPEAPESLRQTLRQHSECLNFPTEESQHV